jgi:Tol biopolymer transport system component
VNQKRSLLSRLFITVFFIVVIGLLSSSAFATSNRATVFLQQATATPATDSQLQIDITDVRIEHEIICTTCGEDEEPARPDTFLLFLVVDTVIRGETIAIESGDVTLIAERNFDFLVYGGGASDVCADCDFSLSGDGLIAARFIFMIDSSVTNKTFTLHIGDAVSLPFSLPPISLSPQWLSTGQIVFQFRQDGNFAYYAMNVDRSNVQRLMDAPDRSIDLRWSSDASRIAFSSYADGNYEIYVMDADGSNVQQLTNNNTSNFGPAWSPDGSQIAFYSYSDGDGEIYVMDADGSDVQQLTDNDTYDSSPTWSPDGSQIVFASDRDGNSELYVMDADGSNVTRLTNDEEDEYTPAWSPDGSQIAFSLLSDENYEIYVMNADGSNMTQLTDDAAYDLSPMWSPDSRQIVFSSDRDGHAEIYVMDADGGNLTRLTVAD